MSGCSSTSSPLENLWWVGMLGSMVGSFFSALGLNLQKKAHNLYRSGKGTRADALHDPMWISGLVLIILNSIIDIPTFGLAPQTLLASLGAVTLVYNVLLAPIILKERLSRRDILSTIIILSGTTLAVVFSSKVNPVYTVTSITASFERVPVVIYESCVIIAIVSLLVHDYWLCTRQLKKEPLLEDKVNRHWSIYRTSTNGFELAVASGVFGGQSAMFMKIVIELLESTITGFESALTNWSLYFYVFVLATILFCQMKLLNNALACSDALYVVPIYQVCYILFATIGGGVFYEEFSCFDLASALCFPLGITITVFGIYLLSFRKGTEILAADVSSGHHATEPHNSVKLIAPLVSPGSVPYGIGLMDDLQEPLHGASYDHV